MPLAISVPISRWVFPAAFFCIFNFTERMNKMLSLKDVIDNNNGNEEDVLKLKQNLQQLGYYKTPKYGMTGYTDDETFEGIKKFQKDNNLTVDGVLKPGGETESKLNERLNNQEKHMVSPKGLLTETSQSSQNCLRETTKDDTWGKLPNNSLNKPLFERKDASSWQNISSVSPERDKLNNLMQKNSESIRKHESCISHPYIDTTGNITVGCGVNVNKWENFSKQPWNRKSDKKAIKEGYDSLVNLKSKMSVTNGGTGYNVKASYYKDKTNLRLNDMHGVYMNKAREIMEPHIQYLNAQGIDFFSLPEEVQNAHFDMVYNLGPSKFRKENWKEYYKALEYRKYDEMAIQSHRRGIDPERNQYVHDLLMKAHNNRK